MMCEFIIMKFPQWKAFCLGGGVNLCNLLIILLILTYCDSVRLTCLLASNLLHRFFASPITVSQYSWDTELGFNTPPSCASQLAAAAAATPYLP